MKPILLTFFLAFFSIASFAQVAAITGPSTACVGVSNLWSDATTGGTWSTSNSSVVSIGGASPAVTAVSVGVATLSYTALSGSTATLTISVTAAPSPITGTASVCSGFTTALSSSSGGTWTSSNISLATVGSGSGIVTGVAAGVLIITNVISAGCYLTQAVTVNPNPSAITGSSTVCMGQSTTLSDASSGGTWSSSSSAILTTTWATGVVTGVAAGFSADISYTLPTGCYTTHPVTVLASPAYISGTTSLCPGNATTLTTYAGGGVWTSSNTTIAAIGSSSGVISAVAVGTVTVTNTLSTGCSASTGLTVNPNPTTITGITTLCDGSTTTLSSTSGVAWTSSNSGVAPVNSTTGIVIGVAAGTATITATLPTGCFVTTSVIVNPTPAAITGSTFICSSGTTTLSDATPGGSWNSSNPSIVTVGAATGVVTAIATGIATISYVLPTGCFATTPFIVANPATASYTVTGGGAYCAGGSGVTVGLSNSQSGVSYQLLHSGTSVGFPVMGTGSAFNFPVQAGTGSYTIAANYGSSCSSTMTGSVTVTTNPLPTAYTVSGGGAPGSIVTLSGSTSGINYQLMLGGSFIGSALSGTGAALNFGAQSTAGVYTVIATSAITGCQSNMIGSATIGGSLTVYTVTGTGSTCSGGSGVTISLSGSQTSIPYTLLRGTTSVTTVTGTGSAISFGTFTTAGIYTVVGSYGSPSQTTMTGAVTVNASPVAFPVTGGGSFCYGGAGVSIGVSNSQNGFAYYLYFGSTMVSTATGTGSPISFGNMGSAGTYTVTAVDPTTSCSTNMSGSATVSVNPLPTAFTLSGGGSYCAGGAGVNINLSGSQTGFIYQLTNGGVSVAPALTGTGASISWTMVTAATYSVVATNPVTGCTAWMTGNPVVSVIPMATVYSVTGGGTSCTSVTIGLSNSQTGVTYQLYNGTTPVGSTVSGTGAALSFGPQTTSGTYTVVANPGTSCSALMSGSAVVTITSPTAYAVTGGGAYCPGGSGVAVGVSNSQTGINYQLYNGGTAVGSTVAGTGSAIGFGFMTAAGTYSVVANPGTACPVTMTGTATVTVYTSPTTLPAIIAVGGGGAYCFGGSGVAITLPASAVGVNYQLYRGSIVMGSPVAGVGGALNLGLQTVAGTYTVIATNTTTGCSRSMSGSATVSVLPSPSAYSVTGGGSYCTGGSGVPVGLSGSNSGITYKLYRGGTATGAFIPGSGVAITFGSQTIAGTYTVVAMNATTFCTSNMTGSATVSISAPTTYTVTGGGAICTSSTGAAIGLSGSSTGTSYQLYRGTTPVGSPIAGTTGSAISFGMQTTAGTYTVRATTATGCTATMAGSATISTLAGPYSFTVTGGGSYCSGGSGVVVGLSGSVTGTTYQLLYGGTVVGTVSGTGAPLSFGLRTAAGIYTVVATITSTGCNGIMSGSVTVVINPLPAAITGSIFTVRPTASITLSDATGGGSWTSSSTGIATVGVSTGLVTGVTLGTTTISYTLPTGCRATRMVSVTPTGFRPEEPAVINTGNEPDLSSVYIAPNPNHGTFSIKGQLGDLKDQVVSIEIINLMGQRIYGSEITPVNGAISEQVQLTGNLPNGIYLMTLRAGEAVRIFRIAIEQ